MLAERAVFRWWLCPSKLGVFLGFPLGLHTSVGFAVPLLLYPEVGSRNGVG